MKLTLKQIAPQVDITALGDESRRYTLGKPDKRSLFGLHADTGEILPGQVSTALVSEVGGQVLLTVVFVVDGDSVLVEGHGL